MYLEEYQTFKTKQEMNEAIGKHLDDHRYDLTESTRDVLGFVTRYAVKFAGVAHLKVSTIAKAVGKSEKTVRRALNKLAECKIIRKVKMIRKVKGGTGANVIQILPYDQAQVSKRREAVKTTESKTEHTKSASEPYFSFKLKNSLNKRNEGVPIFDHTFVSSSVPSEFVDGIAPYFGSAKEIYRLWGRLKLAARKTGLEVNFEDYMVQWIKTFKEALYTFKNTSVQTDLYGYVYGAWRTAMAVIARQQVPANKRPFDYDWLNAESSRPVPFYDWIKA